MFSIVLKHIFRNIRKNKFSGVLIIISITLAATIFYIDLQINDDIKMISNKLYESVAGGYDVRVSADDGTFAYSEADFATAKALPILYSAGKLTTDTTCNVVIASVDCSEIIRRGILSFEIEQPKDAMNSVIISSDKAARFNLKQGDTISVATESSVENYTITDICDSCGIFTNGGANVLEVFVSAPPTDIASEVWLDIEGDILREAQSLQESLPTLKVDVLTDDLYASDQVASVERILVVIFVLISLMGLYIINSVSTLMLRARIKLIGIFRSIGASRSGMDRLLLAEFSIYGFISGLLSIACGELLRSLLARFYYQGANIGHTLHFQYMLLTILFAVCLSASVTFVAIRRANKEKIRNILLESTETAKPPSYRQAAIGLLLLLIAVFLQSVNTKYIFLIIVLEMGLIILGCTLLLPMLLGWISKITSKSALRRGNAETWLSLRNLAANKINTSSAILTTLVIAVTLVIFVCSSSMLIYFDSYYNIFPYDVMIKGTELPASSFAFISDYDTVESVVTEFWNAQRTYINDQRDEELRIRFVRRYGWTDGITFLGVSPNKLEDEHVIIDALYATRNGLHVGDAVVFTSPRDGRVFEAVIDGLCDSSLFNARRTSVILTESDYDAYVGLAPEIVGITLCEGVDRADFITTLSDDLFMRTGERIKIWVKEAFINEEFKSARDGLLVASVIPVFAIALAMIGLINNQLISFGRRKREYAILRSIAMDRVQLRKVIFNEMIAIFAIGVVVGIALGLWLSDIVQDMVFSLVAYIEISFQLPVLLAIIAGTFVLLSLTVLMPMYMLSKLNIVEEIKYE